MDDTSRTTSPEPPSPGKWIGRVLIAVLLGEGIWGLIVALTNNLILPLLARTMGGDAQSPLYLGKGDFNVPAVFTSVLELCFAGIAAVVLNSWVQRKPRGVRSQSLRVSPVAPPLARPAIVSVPASAPPPVSVPVPAPPAPSTSAQLSSTLPQEQFWSPPEPPRPKTATVAPAAAKPQKPKTPKEVYYNIVGEPINPTDE